MSTNSVDDPLQLLALFTLSDLEDNRSGHISDRQAARLEAQMRALVISAALLLIGAVLILGLVISGRAPWPLLVFDISLGCIAGMALTRASRRRADVRQRWAVSYEGPLIKATQPDRSGIGRIRHFLQIGEEGQRLTLTVPAFVYTSMPEEGNYRVFVAKHSRARLSIDRTASRTSAPDHSPPEPDQAQEVYW